MSRGPRVAPEASEATAGPVVLAADGELATRKAVTGIDSRLVQRYDGAFPSGVDGQLVYRVDLGTFWWYDDGAATWTELAAGSSSGASIDDSIAVGLLL